MTTTKSATQKVKRLQSVGLYTESLNTGVEYAVREDGAVFYREKFWNDTYRCYSATKWQRASHWDSTFEGTPSSVAVGFASRGNHYFVESKRLRLPQDEK